MKILIITFLALIICFACNQKSDTSAQIEKSIAVLPFDNMSDNPMEGVWKRTMTYSILNEDTLNYQDSELQHIIYLDGYYMWSSEPASTGEWHGFGNYILEGDSILRQHIITMSIPMQNVMGGGKIATLHIKELTKDSYIQMVSFITPEGVRTDYQHYIKLQPSH